MTAKKLQNFLEEHGFSVSFFSQDSQKNAEIEKWTDGGVDMIFCLMPFTAEQFIERVNNFDVDEEIDMHRQDKRYRDAFRISESVKDFTDFHDHLKEVAALLPTKK